MVKPKYDLTGKRFGRLTVLYQTDDYVEPSGGSRTAKWHCICDCGNECDKLATLLTRDKTHSCGCYAIEVVRAASKKYNRYDLSKEYGIGYTENDSEFYFDLEDYDKIKDRCWYLSDGYVVSGNNIKMHRLVTGCTPTEEVDHIDHNHNDNRKQNLRVGTHQENMMNKKLYKSNTSGVPGINWSKSHNKWHVRIQFKGKRIDLGYYDDLDMAKRVREDAEKLYFQDYRYKGETV